MTSGKAAQAWAELNERQQAYLLALYKLDQAAEEHQRGAWAAGSRPKPAAEWRWIRYGYVNVGPLAPRGTMQQELDARNRRDQGAGATLAALADRGLIEQRRDELDPAVYHQLWYRTDTYHVSVKLTKLGRAAARASGTDDRRPARTPRGLLSEWLWTVLIQVWSADDAGVEETARITAWHYLEKRRGGALVEHRRGGGPGGGRYVISDLGRQHYREHWAAYARLYPQIVAPHPDGERVWPTEVDARLRDLERMAGAIGGHLARVVEEHDQLSTPPAEPRYASPWDELDGPELAEARQLRAVRDADAAKRAEERRALLGEQIPHLRRLYRAAVARYAGVAVAVTQAVIDGTDPAAALTAPPVLLDDTTGRPTELGCPVTGLTGVDTDIAARHRTALAGPPPERPTRRRRTRTDVTTRPPVDAPAKNLKQYADYLADLVNGGQLRRLRLRVPTRAAAGAQG